MISDVLAIRVNARIVCAVLMGTDGADAYGHMTGWKLPRWRKPFTVESYLPDGWQPEQDVFADL